MKTLIKNGRIITATDDYHADVFIDGETVSCIGKNLPMQADKTLDAGITTFKLFMAYPGVFMIDDQTMFRVMQSAGEAGGMTLVHAENGDAITQLINNLLAAGKVEPKYHAQSRPPTMQADGVARAVRVAEVAKAP